VRSGFIVTSIVLHAAAMACGLAMSAYTSRRLPPPLPHVTIASSAASMPAAPVELPRPDVVVEALVVDLVANELAVVEPLPPRVVTVVDPPPVASPPTRREPTRARLRPPPEPDPEPLPAATAAAAQPFVEAQRYADNPPPQYPDHERRAGHEGVVVLAVSIDSLGTVTGIELRTPAPFPGLNREALRAVRAWRFVPARQNGAPVASTTEVVVEFRLRDAAR